MNQLVPLPSPATVLPTLVAASDDRAQLRFVEFFGITIRNPHTGALTCGLREFLSWCEARALRRS